MTVADLMLGQCAHIVAIDAPPALEAKLREIGFCEGDHVQMLAFGPISAKPLAVRLNRRVIAMRHDEAAALTIGAAQ